MGVSGIVKDTELRPFQLEGARGIYKFKGRALLADDQGLGKTLQALYWIKKIPKHRPTVIVTPATMKWTWQAEAMMHFNLRTEVLDGRRPKRFMSLPGPIIVVNYDILASWLPCLLKHQPQCVVIDEVQYLKNPHAKRTKACKKLVQFARSVVGLSGTPITNRPIEFWSSLNIIRPDLFPDYGVFAWTYCKPHYTPWGWKFDGACRLPQLNRILRKHLMIRRLKKDVLPELPDKVRRVISFRLRDKGNAEYHKAENDFLNWLKEKDPAKHSRAKKSPALTKVGYLLRLVSQLKLNWTEAWIQEFFETHPGEKLVGLTMHTFVIDHLMKRFPNCVIIDGRVTGRKRTDAVRMFQTNPRVKLLLGNWRAASIGITLTAAHNAASLDFPWTPGDLMQGEDRIHRIGQKKNCMIHYLVVLNTIEEKLMRVLQKKSAVLDAVLNGKALNGDLNIFDELLADMKTK